MKLNRMIDHTLLKANASKEEITKIIDEAKKHNFWSICINPSWIRYAAESLSGTNTKVCTVIGFPLGANTSDVKAFETKDAIENGADEIDMVINIGELKSGNYIKVQKDIEAVVNAANKKALVKVIIETALLSRDEIIKACELSKSAGADFVKTSTGFSTKGAVAEDITLMRKTVGLNMGVKASGGIHNQEDAKSMITAGANRLGTSASVEIISGKTGEGY